MCAFVLFCFLATAACVSLMVAIVGAAVVTVHFAIPVLLLVAVWWICTFVYQWLVPGEPAFQVLQPTAPELELLQHRGSATQVKIVYVPAFLGSYHRTLDHSNSLRLELGAPWPLTDR